MTTPAGPKLCKDCRWIVPSRHDTGWAKCGHPSVTIPAKPNLVTGGMEAPDQPICFAMRMKLERCGPDAKLFEPRGSSSGSDSVSP
jgi:hypothetical protein